MVIDCFSKGVGGYPKPYITYKINFLQIILELKIRINSEFVNPYQEN